MKKDIEWLKEKVQKRIDKLPRTYSGTYIEGSRDAYDLTLQDINELDEPEVLSEEWINKNSAVGQFMTSEGLNIYKFVKADKLKNLLVPKQDVPIVPTWFDKWFVEGMNRDTEHAMYHISRVGWGHGLEVDGVNKTNDITINKKKYMTAIINGYEVEKESKYIIDLDDEEISDGNHYLKRLEMSVDGVNIVAGDSLNSITFESVEEAQLIANYVGGRVKELEE